jgi:ankyrin repeat protein
VLHWALLRASEQERTVRLLLEQGAKPDVYYTLATGGVEEVRQAIASDPRVVREAERASKALMVAIVWDRPAVVKLLAEQGADMNGDIVRWLYSRIESTALHWAISLNKMDVARMLVECGADVNQPGARGQRPLHWAVWRRAEDVQFFLDRGARVAAVDEQGRTALHLAAEHDADSAVLEALLKAGASREARDKQGRRPVDLLRGGKHQVRNAELLVG